jgi:hypothetical protein
MNVSQDKRAEQANARTLDELRRIEHKRGYSVGWADKVYQARQNKTRKPQAFQQQFRKDV